MKEAKDFKTLEAYKQYLLGLRGLIKRNHGIKAKNNVMVFKVNLEDEVKIRERAQQLGISVSEFMRGIILKQVNRRKLK